MPIKPQADLYARYMSTFNDGLRAASATDAGGAAIALDTAIRDIGARMRACHDGGRRIMLVGNGGSASICSHLATDFSKNGGMRATTFNDGSVLTCLGNDYGYEHVFAKQVEWHGVEGDMLIAISSSGRSLNILNAAASARKLNCVIVTLSGFKPDNPLRSLGDINIYFPSSEYGFVEVGHLAILHAALDIQMGWQGKA
jgi:D-sedoheptulose 7-phosphate isomerase